MDQAYQRAMRDGTQEEQDAAVLRTKEWPENWGPPPEPGEDDIRRLSCERYTLTAIRAHRFLRGTTLREAARVVGQHRIDAGLELRGICARVHGWVEIRNVAKTDPTTGVTTFHHGGWVPPA